MTTDLRALCARMADELDYYRQLLMDDRREVHALATEARTALAQPAPPADGEVRELVVLFQVGAECGGGARLTPEQCGSSAALLERLSEGPAVQSREPASVVEQPSDEEIMELMPEQMRQDLAAAARAIAADADTTDSNHRARGLARVILNRHAVDHARAVLARWGRSSPPQPIPVAERLPEANIKVLARYFNALGKGRTICAIWVPAKSRSEDHDLFDDDFTEYDEEDDKFYWPEGWYEAIENWDELGLVKVHEGEVAHWQPLPKWPALPLPLPSGEGES